MKNLRKLSNYTIAGFLAVGVLVLSFFAYQAKIQADTIVPGYATAHVGLNVTVPDARAVPFTVKFTPTNGSKTYYFKSREFTFTVAGLNTVEWYIRKIPAGTYKVSVDSSNNELDGSPVQATLVSDQVNQTSEFQLNLGDPVDQTVEQTATDTPEPTATAVEETPTPTSTASAAALETF